MKETKEEILEVALRILNARGLSALSTRAVADELGLSPGNVSYHFPKKENLVLALSARHGERNRELFGREVATIGDLIALFRALFHAQWGSRGLLLALPDLIETFEDARALYRKNERARRGRLLEILTVLRERSVLVGDARALARCVAHLSLIGRFWIAEARVSYPRASEQRVVQHYLALVADTLLPHASGPARAQLAGVLEGWIGGDE